MTEHQRLREIVRATPWLMRALETVRSVGPPDAHIGAGAVRATVWDILHGHSASLALTDVDVPYFDLSDLSAEREEAYRRRLAAEEPDLVWDVVNQASVHLWYEGRFGAPIAPLPSIEDGIASWPETATAVGLSMDGSGHIRVIAPYGLSDLFGCVVRNTGRVSQAQFEARVEAKRWSERWPKVRIDYSFA